MYGISRPGELHLSPGIAKSKVHFLSVLDNQHEFNFEILKIILKET